MSSQDVDLLERVRTTLAASGGKATPDKVASALRMEGGLVSNQAVLDLVETLRRETVGLGPLEGLLERPGITDVVVNGAAEVFVDAGDGLVRTSVTFPDDASVRRLAQRLASVGGRRLDDASPFVDVRLPDGIRFHAVLSPIARPGTLISLRIPSRIAFSVDDLRDRGTLSELGATLLTELVRARVSFVVSGGTGSGKTTLLNAMLGLVDHRDRIVVVEDASELRPDHPHVVALEGRTANIEGAGGIMLAVLVRQALRMRPDRLVVGEVRGAEVTDLLAALNTGHEGGCGTVHANSTVDVPARFEALGVAAGLSREAVHSQLASAIAVVVHLARLADGRRRLQEISVLGLQGDGHVLVRPAVTFGADDAATAGPAADDLDRLLGAA